MRFGLKYEYNDYLKCVHATMGGWMRVDYDLNKIFLRAQSLENSHTHIHNVYYTFWLGRMRNTWYINYKLCLIHRVAKCSIHFCCSNCWSSIVLWWWRWRAGNANDNGWTKLSKSSEIQLCLSLVHIRQHSFRFVVKIAYRQPNDFMTTSFTPLFIYVPFSLCSRVFGWFVIFFRLWFFIISLPQ